MRRVTFYYLVEGKDVVVTRRITGGGGRSRILLRSTTDAAGLMKRARSRTLRLTLTIVLVFVVCYTVSLSSPPVDAKEPVMAKSRDDLMNLMLFPALCPHHALVSKDPTSSKNVNPHVCLFVRSGSSRA